MSSGEENSDMSGPLDKRCWGISPQSFEVERSLWLSTTKQKVAMKTPRNGHHDI